MADWAVFARAASGQRTGQVEEHTSIDVTPRFNDVGSYTLKGVPPATVIARGLLAPRAGLEFERDGKVVLSGPITADDRTYNATTDTWDFSGDDDTVFTRWRVVHPQPTTAAPPYTSSAYDVSTGPASTVLLHYIDVNAGPSALARRQIPGLTLAADPAIGAPLRFGGRWQNLLTIVQWAARLGDIAFTVLGLQVQVYQPNDLSDTIVLSTDLGNLAEYRLSRKAPDANFVYVGGGGQGTSRVVRQGQDSPSVAGWGVIEQFVDRRDTTDTTELDGEITRQLLDKAGPVAITAKPIDLEQMRYGEHYQLGDKVTVIVDGLEVVDRIREVRFVRDANTDTVEPGIGNPDVLADLRRTRLSRRYGELARRMTALEAT